jgi:hypothetical protein
LLKRYKRFRDISYRLVNTKLIRAIPKTGIETPARRLGMWRRDAIVFDSEDQANVLFDHALFDCYEKGANVVERWAAENPPAPGSEEETVLAGMKAAYFSLFQIEQVFPGLGMRVHDLFADRDHLLMDVQFSQTAVPRLALATRVFPFGDFIMSSGAVLPLEDASVLEIDAYLAAQDLRMATIHGLAPAKQGEIAGQIIRICLKHGASERVRYAPAGGEPDDFGRPTPLRRSAGQVGRNDPCPCGSGKKHKKCCGPGVSSD